MCAENDRKPDVKSIQNIIENYNRNENAIVEQLYFEVSHGTTIGGFREDIWRGMFEQIVPKKFVIEQSVFIIDSDGRVSNEVDLAIFDETYTPYIFRYGRLKFLPIEAVAVAIECKSTSLNQTVLSNWAQGIAALKTSLHSYTRTISSIVIGHKTEGRKTTQTATRPLRILCCMNERIINRSLGEKGSEEPLFDIIIRAIQVEKSPEVPKDKCTGKSKEGHLFIEIDKHKKTLKDWYFSLNHADADMLQGKIIDDGSTINEIKLNSYEVKGCPLLTLNLTLNQLLMLINNPIPFPHQAYVKMFNDNAKEGK